MILAVFFCKGGLQWLYNLGCKQCMMNITSIYKKDNAGMKTQKLWIDFAKQVGSDGPSKIVFQRRFVVIVYPMQARRVCTLGNCRCRKCSDIHTGCPKWDQNILSYILLFHRLVVVVVWVLSIFLAVPIILTKVLGIAIDNDKKHINA